jgi:signal transduction histidine kinase
VLTVHARGKHHVRTLNNFIRMINHDLRTPLTVSLSAMSVLDEMNLEIVPKQKDMLERIRGNLNYTSEILDKAADGAKIDPETGYYNISREVVDMVALVKELVEDQKLRAQRSKITLTAEIDDTAPILSLDKIMIQRALMNLVDNAVKYTKEGGTVHVSLQTDDRRLIFKVKDTGIGIPPEKLARLFERFYRVQQRGTERIKGTGLGLFIVKHIAQRHGGDVTVETEPGKGSTFTLWLPMEGANIPGAVS